MFAFPVTALAESESSEPIPEQKGQVPVIPVVELANLEILDDLLGTFEEIVYEDDEQKKAGLVEEEGSEDRFIQLNCPALQAAIVGKNHFKGATLIIFRFLYQI
jgi:hypothetical protein